jgi:hypothetical protein
MQAELFNRISKEFNNYKDDCLRLNLMEYVDQYKNLYYDVITKNSTNLNTDKIIKQKDLLYVTRLTDVSIFWKIICNKYKNLAIAAAIVLGKPTYNAFQEMVFSRGTYADTSLKKCLKELSFEMSVLNALNIASIESIKEQLILINNYELFLTPP